MDSSFLVRLKLGELYVNIYGLIGKSLFIGFARDYLYGYGKFFLLEVMVAKSKVKLGTRFLVIFETKF